MPDDRIATKSPATLDTEDIFHLTNLSPRMTGLPMCIWVSLQGNARHDVRIKVNMSHGNHMNIDNVAIVGLRPSVRVIAGRLSPEDLSLVVDWIDLNREAVLAYWDCTIDTGQLLEQLRRLES